MHYLLSWVLCNIYEPCEGEQRNEFTDWIYGLDIDDSENWFSLVILILFDPLKTEIGQGETLMICFFLMILFDHKICGITDQ